MEWGTIFGKDFEAHGIGHVVTLVVFGLSPKPQVARRAETATWGDFLAQALSTCHEVGRQNLDIFCHMKRAAV